MGLCNSPDIVQEKMNEWFNGLEYIRAYIHDQWIINNGDFKDHLNKANIVLNKLRLHNQCRKFVFAIMKMIIKLNQL